MFNNLIGKNKELGRFLFCERYTLPPVKNAMYIAEGQDLKRGAVVDVNGVLVGTNSLMPYAVLEFDCDTRDGGKEASVFIKGEFNFDKLSFASGLSKSDMDNIVYNGNSVGIVIKPYEYAEGFSPAMAPAGTSKSNPLMTSADTERMIDAMKPIDDMTLRFEFSKKDYNPETAGVGSAGTWTKVDSPTLNVWDWTNEETDWHNSFKGAFPDADNEVRVIAAGDTSSVTTFNGMFSGTWTSTPTNYNYNPTLRNNIVSCVPFNIDSATDLGAIFCSTALREYVQFDYSNNDGATAPTMFADTLIEEIGDVVLGVKNAGGMFTQNDKLKKIGNISFDSSKLDADTNLNLIAFTTRNRYTNVLEEVGNITGTENVKKFITTFQSCYKLKKIGSIDCTSGVDFQAMFSACDSLEEVPTLIGIGTASITTIYQMFSGCTRIKSIPLFDTSHATSIKSAFRGCKSIRDIPNYNFDSVTDCTEVFRDTLSVHTGITEAYNKLIARGASLAQYSQAFKNCGIDTEEGRAALAQIPQSWGGLAEG